MGVIRISQGEIHSSYTYSCSILTYTYDIINLGGSRVVCNTSSNMIMVFKSIHPLFFFTEKIHIEILFSNFTRQSPWLWKKVIFRRVWFWKKKNRPHILSMHKDDLSLRTKERAWFSLKGFLMVLRSRSTEIGFFLHSTKCEVDFFLLI